MNFINDETVPMNRTEDCKVMGRLVVLPTTPDKITAENVLTPEKLGTLFGFDFPTLPDVIELARSADYFVSFNPIMPDGMHLYKGTRPMEIPISFTLATSSAYCTEGPLTLLKLAARLHSFVLPIIEGGGRGTVTPMRAGDLFSKPLRDQLAAATTPEQLAAVKATPLYADEKKRLGVTDENSLAHDSTYSSTVTTLSTSNGKGQVYPPATCLLTLMWTGKDGPGIACIGYIKDVRVRLKKVWRSASNGAYNLPESGDFEFTFVHRPSHRNDWGILKGGGGFAGAPVISEVHAFAKDVRDRFYNTVALAPAANYNSYDPAARTPSTAAGGNTGLLTPEMQDMQNTINAAARIQSPNSALSFLTPLKMPGTL